MGANALAAGSVAARAISELKTLRKDQSCSSAVLGEALGCDATTIASSLAAYVKSGVVSVRKEGRLNFYSIGPGKAEKTDDEPPDDDEPRQRTVKATVGTVAQTTGHASVFHAAGAVPHPTTWSKPAVAPRPSKKTALARVERGASVPARRPRVTVAVVTALPPVDTPPPTALAERRPVQHRRARHRGRQPGACPSLARTDDRARRLPPAARPAHRKQPPLAHKKG